MLTEIIPEIIEEPVKAGCAPGNETLGYMAGEISRLRGTLRLLRDGMKDAPNNNIVDFIDATLSPNAERIRAEIQP